MIARVRASESRVPADRVLVVIGDRRPAKIDNQSYLAGQKEVEGGYIGIPSNSAESPIIAIKEIKIRC